MMMALGVQSHSDRILTLVVCTRSWGCVETALKHYSLTVSLHVSLHVPLSCYVSPFNYHSLFTSPICCVFQLFPLLIYIQNVVLPLYDILYIVFTI